MSVFQKTSAAKGKVDQRRKEYQDAHAPDGTNYHLAKTRKNAYVKITANSVTLPTTVDTYDKLYSNKEGKPDVILDSVTITEGSDFGMLRTVEAQFTCLSRSAFKKYEKAFLRPGGILTVKVGYTQGGSSLNLSDFQICKYNFELDAKNRYKCGFKAYGATPFINEVELSTMGNFGSETVKVGGFSDSPVTTIAQHMKYVAQGNGVLANVDISSWTVEDSAVLIIDNPMAWTPSNFFMKKVHKILQAVGIVSDDQSKRIYCTLQWLIGAIQTYLIAPNLESNMKGRKLVCNGSVSKGQHEIEQIGSAYPMSFVLPGGKKGSSGGPGHYGSHSDHSGTEEELNFTSYASSWGGPVISGKKGDYSKILVSYDYVASKLFGASKEKGSVKSTEKSTSEGNKKETPKVKVSQVLDTLFNDIFSATGGLVQLATQENPDNSKQLLIVARNAGGSGIKETIFDPINGDGITRKCTVKCDIPANDAYAVANGAGGGKSGYTADEIAEKKKAANDANKKAASQIKKAKSNITKYMEYNLSASEFANEDCDALAACFKLLVEKASKKQQVEMSIDDHIWPLELNIEIDGTSGFRFGDVVNTTFLPGNYQGKGIKPSFVVLEVTHEISNNDWVTKLKSQCHLINA